MFHVSSLKRFHSDGTYQPPALPAVSGDDLEWTVDYISGTRDSPRRQYKVHWIGGGYGWHDAMLMHNCEEHIREYWRSRNQIPPEGAFPLSLDKLSDLLEGKQA